MHAQVSRSLISWVRLGTEDAGGGKGWVPRSPLKTPLDRRVGDRGQRVQKGRAPASP